MRRTGGPPRRTSGGRRMPPKGALEPSTGAATPELRSRTEAGPGVPGIGVTPRVSPLAGPSQQPREWAPGAGEDSSQQEAARPARAEGCAEQASPVTKGQGQVARRLTPKAKAMKLDAVRRRAGPDTISPHTRRALRANLNRRSTLLPPAHWRRTGRRWPLPGSHFAHPTARLGPSDGEAGDPHSRRRARKGFSGHAPAGGLSLRSASAAETTEPGLSLIGRATSEPAVSRGRDRACHSRAWTRGPQLLRRR